MPDYMDNDESSPSTSGSTPMDQTPEKADETEENLALVPKSFFKNEPKPGGREEVEIVQVYEDECSIKCVYKDEEKSESEEEMAEGETAPEDEMMT
jgi:hypothetical protein